jgi:hypothetical protein
MAEAVSNWRQGLKNHLLAVSMCSTRSPWKLRDNCRTRTDNAGRNRNRMEAREKNLENYDVFHEKKLLGHYLSWLLVGGFSSKT